MTHYGACAASIASSACREGSEDPYRALGRPSTRRSISAVGEAPAPAPAPSASAGRARRPSPQEAAAPWADGALPRTEAAAHRADALARSLSGARDRLALPLAHLAASLVRERAWCTFGFARAADFTREHFGRSARWLRDLAALHQALSTFDALAAALTGDDGGPPLGRRRVLLISRVASAETLSGWIALSRRLTVRELQSAVAQARRPNGSPQPEGASDPEACDLEDCADRSLVRVRSPRAVVAAFDEAIDLYRAVEGSEATVTSFVEALVAEASAGGPPPQPDLPHDADLTRTGGAPAPAVIAAALARSTDRWRHLPQPADASWGLALGRSTLARLAVISRDAGSGTPAERVARMKELIGIENEIEIHLGRLLASMGEQNVWNRLRFAGMGHYAEERLGLSRTTVQSRARAARLLGRFPLLRHAYERDILGLEAALIVGRILSAPDADGADIEGDWVCHASELTVKRLRDEARALDRSRAFGLRPGPGAASGDRPVPGATWPPLSDAAWHASLRRAPGTARRRVAALGLIALGVRPIVPGAPPAPSAPAFCPASAFIPDPDVFLRLTLPDDLAARFLAAVEIARRRVAEQVEPIPWDADWPADAATPALLAARTFSIRCRRIPAWVGLLALIEDFVATWDPDERADDVPDDPVLVRDGWRCAAPGCSSRRNLEVHHVHYRSRGGGDEEWNRVCLCRFHHQRGEHGGLARCSGRAPLGLTWRLGAGAIASWYRNDRRIRSPAPGPR